MTPLDALLIPAWAADAATVRSILAIAEQAIATPTALAAYAPKRLPGGDRATTRNGVAIISASGPMFKRSGWLTDLLGGTAYETMRRDLQAAVDNPSINAILLNVDTPGGEAAGVGELAAAVAGFRGVKPIVAYAGDLAASAGYWLASAADSIVIGPGAALGSIGVRATYADTSGRDAARGVQAVEFVSSQSPFKRADLASDDGKARIQTRIDSMAQVFVETVAANRNVSVEHVLANFGRGDVLLGKAAVAAGMADEVGTFESTLAKLAAGKAPARQAPASKSPVPRVAMPVTSVSASKVLPHVPVLPVIPEAVIADRARCQILMEMTAKGSDEAEAECRAAIETGASPEEYRSTVAARSILDALNASRKR